MNKPLSAVDLLEENIIDVMIGSENELLEDGQYIKRSLRWAQHLAALKNLRIDLKHHYKHAELQSWGNDNEVV